MPLTKEIADYAMLLNSPIVMSDIQEIKGLGTHGNVWLLNGFQDDRIVVKYELGDAVMVKSANPAIKAIAPNAALKILSRDELNAIDQYTVNFEQAEREYEALGMPLSAAEKHAGNDFKKMRTKAHQCFVKMEAVNVMDLERPT